MPSPSTYHRIIINSAKYMRSKNLNVKQGMKYGRRGNLFGQGGKLFDQGQET